MLEICAPSNRWSEDHHPNKNHQKPSPPYILVVSGEAKKQQWARFVLKNYEVPSDSNDAALLGRLQVCGGRKLVEKMDPVGGVDELIPLIWAMKKTLVVYGI